jgi:excisionase family DNA binding protein
MEKILLTIHEVAQALSLKPPTIRKWVKTKEFPRVKLGNKAVRFKLDDVHQWLAQQNLNQQPAHN